MKHSTQRILTTHTGSLPRPDSLFHAMTERLAGAAVDETAYSAEVRGAVAGIVRKQVELGIDVVDDGEQSKSGFIAYVNERLGGYEPRSAVARRQWAGSREYLDFPEYYAEHGGPGARTKSVVCTGPISYQGHAQLRADIENFKAALAGTNVVEAFMPSASPASVEGWQLNEYYEDAEAYLYAIGEAMREEYMAIVDAGFLVQLDDPWLAMHYMLNPDKSIDDCLRWAQPRIAAMNHALRDIPPEKVRYHTCYGINIGPRASDFELKHMTGLLLSINAGAYSFEAANPRHEHEWQVWEGVKLPAGKVLIPGVISHTTVLVEHPELVAQRIERFAGVVGRENVIAGSDCGFATNPGGVPEIHETIVWAKFAALSEGARLASQRLWKKAS